MKKIFCFYAFDCPIIVEVTTDKKYYFDYECLYPYTNIKSTYFNENDNFLVDNHSIKVVLEHIFCVVGLLTVKSNSTSSTKLSSIMAVNKNKDCFPALFMDVFCHFEQSVFSKDLIGNLSQLLNSQRDIISENPEVCHIYNIILKSKFSNVHFYTKSKVLFDTSLPPKVLKFLKFCNYHDWVRNSVTDFYFHNHEQNNSDEQRLSHFNQMENQLKLKLYLSMINERRFTYYDDLLKIWWSHRY
ncbi:hypothetical protein SAMN05421796_11291 [Chryseobacterium piscicola]|uniref:Uncharacterized protein n=1 Tax=Chryseobacterium piscicola TaxID=551459 RepID=A0A1N7PCC6_9FLAO|nr:hypothetical protein B0A70_05930 [Chryseobacterium piscicola]SIT08244.1 hypothetical protein SAMN05421796_11291 [Chryseobacterium piscicola]